MNIHFILCGKNLPQMDSTVKRYYQITQFGVESNLRQRNQEVSTWSPPTVSR